MSLVARRLSGAAGKAPGEAAGEAAGEGAGGGAGVTGAAEADGSIGTEGTAAAARVAATLFKRSSVRSDVLPR